jgi:ornithine decarboxylase
MNLKNINDLIKPISFGPSALACVEGAAVTVLSSESDSEVDRARALAVHALSLQGDIEHPLMFMDMEKVLVQFKRWKACLPAVEPYYAVKCNPDPVLVAYLQSLGANFDCATSAEIDLVVNQLGHNPDKVVYSNPCKLASHIRFAKEAGVRLTIIDNMDEIPKIKRNHPNAQVLIRLACADTSSQCPMSCKFGVPNDLVEATLTHAMEHQLEVVGVHFHVGSGCSDPAVYHKALLDARRAFDIGTEIGHKMHTLDLGGGFPGLGLDGECKTSNGVHFEEMAKIINSLLIQLFPQEACNPIRIMAEPGRFMCAGAAFLLTKIHSKCLREDSVRYYLNDGLYGCFNCVLYDHQTVRPETLDRVEGEKVALKATIFGPTCDGFDKILDAVDHLPELNVDDRLVWMSMGAYTTAASTTFNGFPQAKYFYYKTM